MDIAYLTPSQLHSIKPNIVELICYQVLEQTPNGPKYNVSVSVYKMTTTL